ncbi:hypothetical protein C5D18_14905 [Rathayibacter tritici]|nr:hypothetical protein C5D18_14905 [Rathayibacter tritici]
MAAARMLTSTGTVIQGTRAVALTMYSPELSAAIRHRAAPNGHEVSPKGRVAADVEAADHAAR